MTSLSTLPWWSVPLGIFLLGCFILLAATLHRRLRMTPEERWRERYDRRLKRSIRKRGS